MDLLRSALVVFQQATEWPATAGILETAKRMSETTRGRSRVTSRARAGRKLTQKRSVLVRGRRARSEEIDQINSVLIVAALALVGTVVFARMLTLDFAGWDDSITVYANPYLRPFTWGSLSHLWAHAYQGLYIPVSYTLYGLISLLSTRSTTDPRTGSTIDPQLFHLASLGMHLANIVLVFIILRMLVRQEVPAALGALVFAIHPLQVESVAWISELRGVTSAFFSLLAIVRYVCYARAALDVGHDTYRDRRFLSVVVLATVAMLCKPTAVSLPLMLFALDVLCVGRPARRALAATAILLLPGLALTLLTLSAQPVPASLIAPLAQRPIVAADALAFYFAKLVAPWPLTIDYGRMPNQVLHQWWGYVTWVLPATLAFVAWVKRDSKPWLAAAYLVSLAALLPNLGLVPFLFQQYSTVADRYAYLALLGPSIAVAYMLSYIAGRRAYALVGAVLSIWGILAVVQIGYWNDDLALWSHAVAVSGSDTAYTNYGQALAANSRFADAAASYAQATHINAKNAAAFQGLGTAQLDMGHIAPAIIALRNSVRLQPDSSPAHYTLGIALAEAGDVPEAVAELHQALRLNSDPSARARLQKALSTYVRDVRHGQKTPPSRPR
jgi:protein O-mannosyl-transferase